MSIVADSEGICNQLNSDTPAQETPLPTELMEEPTPVPATP